MGGSALAPASSLYSSPDTLGILAASSRGAGALYAQGEVTDRYYYRIFLPFNFHQVPPHSRFYPPQADPRLLFGELIQLIGAQDREGCREGLEVARVVAKIEGYQELTNRLHLHLSHLFMAELQVILNTSDSSIP